MSNKGQFLYKDQRGWLDQVDKLGELRKVENATWQEDIGLITEVVGHTRGSPAVLCDKVPGCAPGYRVLVNPFHSFKRVALTLGLPLDLDVKAALKLWRERLIAARPVEPVCVENGPVMENVLTGDDVDVMKFPTPLWHEADGGRYIGTASADITRDPALSQRYRDKIPVLVVDGRQTLVAPICIADVRDALDGKSMDSA